MPVSWWTTPVERGSASVKLLKRRASGGQDRLTVILRGQPGKGHGADQKRQPGIAVRPKLLLQCRDPAISIAGHIPGCRIAAVQF